MNGLQCSKYLWLVFNASDTIPPTGDATQHIFDEGHIVGDLAKKLYTDGIQVPFDNFRENLRETKALLEERRILFEPGFLADNIYSRLDILQPANGGEWDIIEVKMSTEVKDEHIADVAFQRFCCEKSGLKIRNCSLIHINNRYIRHGEIDPALLFITEDITEQVSEYVCGMQDQIDYMFALISSAACPEVPVGTYCGSPNPCPVTACAESLPENTILDLYYAGKKKYELYYRGICFIKDIPADYKLTRQQEIQQRCENTSQPHIDKAAIKNFINGMQYPLYFFDFETVSSGVPMFDNSRPYQQIPFQFSVHIMESENTIPVHYGYLADGTGDPRPGLINALKETLGSAGSVVAYNQAFEKRVLEQLGQDFPECKEWTETVIARLVDLLVPFRNFDYYNPQQKGSASLKHVLPAVTGKSYEGLEIAKGDDASLAFLKLMFGDISPEERCGIRENLVKYCGLDTEGMIWIMETLAR